MNLVSNAVPESGDTSNVPPAGGTFRFILMTAVEGILYSGSYTLNFRVTSSLTPNSKIWSHNVIQNTL